MSVKVNLAVGALGTTLKKLKQRFSDIGIETKIVEVQKETCYILQGSSEMSLRFEEPC